MIKRDTMKIIITVNSLTKGSGLSKYVYNLCDVLKGDDNELHIITTHAEQPEFEHQLFERDKNIRVHQLHQFSKISRYVKLFFLIWRLKADLLINNYNAPTQFVLPYCKRISKVVHIIHNDTSDFYRIAAINGKYVDGWVAPTPGVRDNFNSYSHGMYADKIVAISHGVELPSKYSVVSNRGNRLELVFVGVLYEHKGVLTLPGIVKILRNHGLDFHLTIIGKGILQEQLRREMAQDIKDGIVDFTGVIPASGVYQYMANAHVFLYPTQLDSFGLVIAEAMINGAVPVVSHLQGITDALVDEGVNGFLIENPKDAKSFVSRIEQLAVNRLLLERMSLEARKKAETSFSLKKFYENYERYFEKLMK